jgi:hypothetical protein
MILFGACRGYLDRIHPGCAAGSSGAVALISNLQGGPR